MRFAKHVFDDTVRAYMDIDVFTHPDHYTWACTGWKIIDYPVNSGSVTQ